MDALRVGFQVAEHDVGKGAADIDGQGVGCHSFSCIGMY